MRTRTSGGRYRNGSRVTCRRQGCYDDNIASGGTLIGTIRTRDPNTDRTPVEINYHGVAFSTGLTLVTSTGVMDITVIYE